MNASGTPNTCKSNGHIAICDSGKRASNAYLTCPEDGNNYGDIANSQYCPHDEISADQRFIALGGGCVLSW